METDDIVAIHQLIARYGHAVDDPDLALLDQVFTEDAVFHSNASGLHFDGFPAIHEWFELGKPPHPPAHQTTNVMVYDLDGDEAKVRSKYLAINPDSGLPRSGDYEDRVVRTAAGWRIRERTSTDRFGGYKFKG